MENLHWLHTSRNFPHYSIRKCHFEIIARIGICRKSFNIKTRANICNNIIIKVKTARTQSVSNPTEANALTQFDYYKTSANRVKKLGNNGSADFWWVRSPHYIYARDFCLVSGSGNASNDAATYTHGLAPFGCI
jgi:hypothetical protein